MINLKNKITLITGGSRGIGAATVKLFCEAGALTIFTFASNKKAAELLVNSIVSNKPFAYKLQLKSEKEVNSLVKKIIQKFGRIDILVNNAGIWKFGKADNMSLAEWNETIDINLNGTFLITREVIPYMKKNKFGRIINITSTAGQRGEAFHSHYAASKGALISYTKSLSSELAEYNITTNSVAPGWVDTEMCKEVFSDKKYKEEVRKAIPVGRIASAEDIAGPILFLASDLARHINGEILNVNGGSVLCG
jgi:3-oxoacyl-[acyl-carrier protein] reductase